MSTEKISYHKAADQFLKAHYENKTSAPLEFRFRFTRDLVMEGKLLAKINLLNEMESEDALVTILFHQRDWPALPDPVAGEKYNLLQEYFHQVHYPDEHRVIVEAEIGQTNDNKNPATALQEVVSDTINSQFCQPDLIENIIRIKEEFNRLNGTNHTELFYLQYYLRLLSNVRYYTPYARENYIAMQEKNLQLMEKRIHWLEDVQQNAERPSPKMSAPLCLTNKETEDAGWDNYFSQLNELFTSSREMVWLELNKESSSVRKVLSKKFSYLSMAYWVFISGLLVGITAFIIALHS
jgi:hypothetical protein